MIKTVDTLHGEMKLVGDDARSRTEAHGFASRGR